MNRFVRWVMGWREWPLHDAVAAGDLASTEAQLEAARVVGGDSAAAALVNGLRVPNRFSNTFWGVTPLMLAFRGGRPDMARQLIRFGARPVPKRGEYPEARAIFFGGGGGDPELLELLIDAHHRAAAAEQQQPRRPREHLGGLGIYDTDDGLCWAFAGDWPEARCQRLLDLMLRDSGWSPRNFESLTQGMETLLHLAANSLFPGVCARLLAAGLSANAPSFGESTPLGAALMRAAMELDERDGSGHTGHTGGGGNGALSGGDDDSNGDGADVEQQQQQQQQQRRRDRQAVVVRALETVRVLLQGGGDVMAVGRAGQSYIEAAEAHEDGALPAGADPQQYAEAGARPVCVQALRHRVGAPWFEEVAALIDEHNGSEWRQVLATAR